MPKLAGDESRPTSFSGISGSEVKKRNMPFQKAKTGGRGAGFGETGGQEKNKDQKMCPCQRGEWGQPDTGGTTKAEGGEPARG